MIKNIYHLADYFGVGSEGYTIHNKIEKALYKSSSCGAWVHFDNDGIIIGSIVEGSDFEIKADKLTYPFPEKSLDQTIEFVEGEVQVVWDDMYYEEEKRTKDMFKELAKKLSK